MDKLRLMRKKRRPQTPAPTLTTVDLIQPLHVQGGHFGAAPGSDRRMMLLNFVVAQATRPRQERPAGREDLWSPNLVAQVMRMLIKVDRDQMGLAQDEVPQAIPRCVAALPRSAMRRLFGLLLQSDETDVDLFYLVDGLRMKLTTGKKAKPFSLQEGTDLLLYYMNPAVFTRASDHERARQQEAERREWAEEYRRQAVQNMETSSEKQQQMLGHQVGEQSEESESDLMELNPYMAEKRRPRGKPPAKPLETDPSAHLLERQRQIQMVGSVLKVFHQVLKAGSEVSGVDKRRVDAALTQATADADALILWLRNEVIRKLSDYARGTTGPTLEQMETIKFRLTVRIASLRLLLEARDQSASCRNLLLLVDDVFWMRRSLEKIVTSLPDEDAPGPANEESNVWEALMADLLPKQIRGLTLDPQPAAVETLMAAFDWIPKKHIYHIPTHIAHRFFYALLRTGQAGEAAKFYSVWSGLDARGKYDETRKEALREFVQKDLPEELVAQLIKDAHTRLNLSMTRTLALTFRSYVPPARRARILPFILARLQLYRLHRYALRRRNWSIQHLEAMASFVAGENRFIVSNSEARRRANPHSELVHHLYRAFLRKVFGKSCVPEDMPPAVAVDDLVSLFNTALLLREYEDALVCARHLKDCGASLPTNSITLIFKNFAQSDPDVAAHALSLLVEGNGEKLAEALPGLAEVLPKHIPTVTVATVVDNVFRTLWGLRYFAAASNLAERAAQSQLGIRLNAHPYAMMKLAASMSEREFAHFVRFHMDEGDVQHFAGALTHICRWWLRGHSISSIMTRTSAGKSEWCAFFLGYPFRELITSNAWLYRIEPAMSLFRTLFLYADMVEYRSCLLLVKRIRQRADLIHYDSQRKYWSFQLWKTMGALLMARRGVPYMPIDSQAWEIPHISTQELQDLSPQLTSIHAGRDPVLEATDEEVIGTGLSTGNKGSAAMLPDAAPAPAPSTVSKWHSKFHGREPQSLAAFQLPILPRPLSPVVEEGYGPFYRGQFVGAFRVPFTIVSQAAMGFGLLGDSNRMRKTINILHSYGLDPIKTETRAQTLYDFSRLGIPRWDAENHKLLKCFPRWSLEDRKEQV